jgi:TetR/AcrR family transcriptional regulator, regulator of cefoperazone and chloramphenicol sensitivity
VAAASDSAPKDSAPDERAPDERAPDDTTARTRIRDAALDLFGRDGINRVTVRAIAAEVGVSPALVVHHFGSMAALRRECDAYVMSMVRGTEDPDRDDAAAGVMAGDATGLSAVLETATPVRRYLARAFLDGTPEAANLFDEIAEVTTAWLDEGVREGWARPTSNSRARGAIYVSWLLAPLAFSDHLERVLGVDDLYETDATIEHAKVAVEMFTHGVFADERALGAWDTVAKERKSR